MEKFGRGADVTGENIIRRMRFACGINKEANTQSEYVIRKLFHGINYYANAPECYVYTYVAYLFHITYFPYNISN